MKLFAKFRDLSEAYCLQEYLEDRGIPIYIGSKDSGPMLGYIVASDCYSIWIEVDGQYPCALKAMNDADYQILNPIDIDEFRRFQEASIKSFRNDFSKLNRYILNAVMILVFVGMGLFIWSNF